VAVPPYVIGFERLRHLAENVAGLGLPASAADPGLGIGNDGGGVNQISLQQRRQPQNDTGGIAAGVGNGSIKFPFSSGASPRMTLVG